jgi:MipA family protein
MKTLKLLCAALLVFGLFAAPVLAMEHAAGLGVASVPDYEGSDDQKGTPLLMLKGNYDSGRSFSLLGTNLKVNLVPSKMYSFGPVLNYRMQRHAVENDQVDAMKSIDAAFEAGVFGGIDVNNVLFGLEFLGDISGEYDGYLVQASAGYRWKAAPTLVIIPKIYTTYADTNYMETYFGVNRHNRGFSTLPYYDPDSGMKDVGLNLVVDYTPWQHWGIMGVLSYSSLLNDAKDSPLVDDEGDDKQTRIGLMGTYRW